MVIGDKCFKMGLHFGPEIICLGIYPEAITRNMGKVICIALFITVTFFSHKDPRIWVFLGTFWHTAINTDH